MNPAFVRGLVAVPASAFVTPADSARAVAEVYTISLLATVPLVVAAVGALLLRRSPAGLRSLVWRSAVAALLIVYAGRALPVHWMAWVVPAGLAAPLVVLGKLQLTVTGQLAPVSRVFDIPGAATAVRVVLWIYWGGVAVVMLSLLGAMLAARARAGAAEPLCDRVWTDLLAEVRMELGLRRAVRLLASPRATVPTTWGFIHPVVLLPTSAADWTPEHRRAVLLHELAHARRGDALFAMAARVVCALYWFHPGAWWVARGMSDDSELAADDRVLAAGVKRSDYAGLLVAASQAARAWPPQEGVTMALNGNRGLRARLAAIVDVRRDVRAPTRSWAALATGVTLAVSAPMSTVELAPTRDVLTTLMRDVRWESRAYAVAGLAQRRDSVEVARVAARADPNPHVRAWAEYALAQPSGRNLPAILSQEY
jgi:beta-lactamase regulating signal transducer with metallopeptidase domain